MWVATDRGQLCSVDRASAETVRCVDLGGRSLSHAATGAGTIWVTSYDDDAVFRIDADDLSVTELEVHQPAGIVVSGHEVWVSAVDQ